MEEYSYTSTHPLGHTWPVTGSLYFTYSAHMKETYENIDLLFKAVSYPKYEWKICGPCGLGLLLGMRSGYTTFCCILLEWDSHTKNIHYNVKDWPMRENSVSGERYVRNQLLVWLPPLHVKLG